MLNDNLSPDTINFKDIAFRNVDEFIIDLKNIFSQIKNCYHNFITNKALYADRAKLQQENKPLIEKVHQLQKDLQERLDFITDPSQVGESTVGNKRSKLIQLKTLNSYLDLTKDLEKNMKILLDFFNTRILDSGISITSKIISRKNNN